MVDCWLFGSSCSIYKTALKSKSSLNEVNQVAQVRCSEYLHRWLFLLSLLSYECLGKTCFYIVQLRIIIKPKSCNGVGPLCTAQQVILYTNYYLVAVNLSLMHKYVWYNSDLLPCPWSCSWHMDTYTSSCELCALCYSMSFWLTLLLSFF